MLGIALRNRLLPGSLVALLLAWLQLRSGNDAYLAIALAAAAFAYLTVAAGRLLLAATAERIADPCAAWVLGLLASCLAIYALTVTLPLTAAGAFAILATAVVALDLALARRLPEPPTDWRALTGFALCVLFTAAWCTRPASADAVLHSEGVLPVWQDYFVHASIVSQFGDLRAAGRQSILLADFPPSFYHFGSYAAAAALAGMLDRPGLPIATSAWLPLGFLAMTVAGHALGERLAGAAGGIAALAAIAIIPDASNYGLRNGLFSFHWMMLAIPGAAYALAAAFMSLVLLVHWNAERSAAALLGSALLAVSILVFRAHVFVLFMPAWIATVVFCHAGNSERRRLIAVLLMALLGTGAAIASMVLVDLASADPSYARFSGHALSRFLLQAHTAQEPTAYTGVYAGLAGEDEPAFAVAAGIGLVFVAALGAFTVLLPAALALARQRNRLQPIDAFPGFLAFCYLLLILFAPVPQHGDSTELTHRPFVLLYAAAAIWTLCLPLRALGTRDARWRARLWPVASAVALAALPVILLSADTLAKPKPDWASSYIDQRAEAGLPAAAAFLRQHARAGDTFATARLNADYAVVDLPTKICALSGVPAYLSRPHLEMIQDAPRKRVAAARLAALRSVDAQSDPASAKRMLHHLGVQWYVVVEGQEPAWDPDRTRATFTAGAISLYAVSR